MIRRLSPIASSRHLLAGAALVLALLGAPEVQAASPQASPTPTPSPTEEVKDVKRAEDVTVTARRREENIQKVPLAVTVKAGNDLAVAAVADISELQGEVPNLSIYQGRNQSTTLTAFMRGVGQADPLWGVDPGVGLYLDDVYIARPQGALLDVFDVQRIEVLRGPQGTLYGKNTIGGAIKYVSRDLVDKWQGGASFTGGNYSTKDFRGSVSGALIEGKLRARVAGGSFRHSGYGTNLFTGKDVSDKDTLAFRAGLDWLPSTSVKVQLSYD